MIKPKQSFLKNANPKADDRNWCVSIFGWQCAPDGTVSGSVVEAVETNNLGLAILAAHRMLDMHGPHAAELITLEIASADLVEGGKV